MVQATAPLRERNNEIAADSDYLRKVAKLGSEKAQDSASRTIRDVREIIGIKSF